MNSSIYLAALILLMRPDLTPEQARSVADAAIDKARTAYEPKPSQPIRVTNEMIEDRIRVTLCEFSYYPALRELLPKVKGNRDRVYAAAKRMIDRNEIEVLKSGRTVGLKLSGDVK